MPSDQHTTETPSEKHKRIKHWMWIALCLVIYDVIAVNAAYFSGLMLRFDFSFEAIPKEYLGAFLDFAPTYTIMTVTVFGILRLYNSIWRFASFNELHRLMFAAVITTIVHDVGITLLFQRMPFSYYIVGPVVQLVLVTAVRFAYRFIKLERSKRSRVQSAVHNAMIFGAGEAGQMIIRELLITERLKTKPVCVIDDNPNKWGRYIHGVPVVGGREDILGAVKKYQVDQILLAVPTMGAGEKRDILQICKETSCELKTLPGIYQLANGEVSLSKMKPVAVEDLLGREPIRVNLEEIFRQIQGKTILVTGGGGSIGSELCRQIANHAPRRLIIFDIYENNAYEIEQELRRKHKNLNLTVLIGSVRDTRRINWVFETYRPQIVYHAAAHKHVPLMENSPNEAIKNNVLGTYKTACAALRNGTERFVLISTDKAVNPTNIMGASKRLCEMVIQSMDAIGKAGRLDLLPDLSAHHEGKTDALAQLDRLLAKNPAKTALRATGNAGATSFVAVRFGNVLGSNGSVIPLFKKQIEAGGPVTVTHPDIIRYFMTIPEAVSLVLQAGINAKGGEIFVLDMGEPVKIVDLARNLIRLSGYKPDEDIKIEYTGLRPGEKLFEEKLMAEEGLQRTDNQLIHIGKPIAFDTALFMRQLTVLAQACQDNSPDIVAVVERLVPTYHPVGEPTKAKTAKAMQAV